MPANILLGQSNFISLRERGALYVDKSGFVRVVLSAPAQVMLFPRPRRFGKTLNMSMAHAFFEIGPDRSALFSDLAIWRDVEARAHFQQHPVITLTFKDVKHKTWAEAEVAIRRVLAAEVRRHAEGLAGSAGAERLAELRPAERDPTAVLLTLCEALFMHHGKEVVLLIDEYDAPVLTAWEHGYYDDAVAFLRSLLSAGLKDNPFLFKGVLTGVLRVARESMFSGLNNVSVYSLLRADLPEQFGLTEPEVFALCEEFGRASEKDEVRRWYDGYVFGETTVYNPWSVVSMLAHPKRPLEPHWVNTSENALVRSLLLEGTDLGAEIAALIEGESIEKEVDENVALRELHGANVWSLLLFAGYLRATHVRVERGRTYASLTIPNFEVRSVWENTFLRWLEDHAGQLEPLHAAMLSGDAPRTEAILSRMLLRHVSSHDVASDQSEAFYHAFVLGLLVSLEKTHFVRSNREVGGGRADVQIIPRRPGLPGVVLEFKRGKGRKKLATCAAEALAQIRDTAYTVELEAAGAAPIRRLGIAFAGKDVVVRGA